MNKYKLFLCLCVALWASALSAQTHWSFDFRQFQYDMTVYYKIVNTAGADLTISDNYQVAAFVGDQCRGIGEVVTATGTNSQTLTYGYLRVYSNISSGETVTFKLYNKSDDTEKFVQGISVPFMSLSSVGVPSEPFVLSVGDEAKPTVMGDADGDGVVDLSDAVAIFEFYMNGEYAGFNEQAADFDGDGTVDLSDAVLIFEYYMNQ